MTQNASKQQERLEKPIGLRDYVENFLREAIVEGRFKPGEKLHERELCELLEVSRPSVREALRKLEAEKLVTTTLHRGPVVAKISPSEASDLYAVRALLEGYAAHQFALLASESEVDELHATVQALHEAGQAGDRKLLLEAKTRFYNVILGGCGNALIRDLLFNLLSRISLLRATSFSRPDRLPESLKEIDALFACIKARDIEAARAAAEQHVRNAQKAALEVLLQQQAG
ncbi:GntR family transcriptional regulator [Castellaniella sp.]|uniref:GntR family transcriptional regulator n=1 Tax=Castellaniella sp. TaxID=1955812 RepID=UPI003C71C275